jgi:hypothetical protein
VLALACLVQSDTCPWASAASGASMADDWNGGDVDQGRGDTSMTSDLGREHTPSDNLQSVNEYYHSWRHEVPLLHNCPDICRTYLMEVTCGNGEDLEESSASCARDIDTLGLESIGHSDHNNWSAVVGEVALLEMIFMSIGRV